MDESHTSNGVGGELQMMLVTVTPDMAGEWLSHKGNFRRLDRKQAEIMTRTIRVMGWLNDGNPFKFDTEGNLRDGQHRAYAIAKLGITVEAYVLKGLKKEAEKAVDTGKPRTLNQILTHRGEQYPDRLASALYCLLAYYDHRLKDGSPGRAFSNWEALALLEKHGTIRESVVRACRLSKIVSVGQIAMLHFVVSAAGLAREVETFLNKLETGVELGPRDPILRLRERMIEGSKVRAKLPPTDKLALLIKAWNFWISGKTCGVLRWRPTGPKKEEWPEIIITVDEALEGGLASSEDADVDPSSEDRAR